MTYQQKLDQLLTICIEKSNAVLMVVKEHGSLRAENVRIAQADWESAENDYSRFLIQIKGNRINTADRLPE